MLMGMSSGSQNDNQIIYSIYNINMTLTTTYDFSFHKIQFYWDYF